MEPRDGLRDYRRQAVGIVKWVIHLPIDLRSKNRIANARDARLSGAIKKRYRNQWVSWARIAALSAGVPLFDNGGKPCKRHVSIVRLMGKGQRPFDRNDGLEGGDAATLRDALQLTHWIGRRLITGAAVVVRDNEEWSTWSYGQERSADGRPGVRVRIEDIEQENAPAAAPAKGCH